MSLRDVQIHLDKARRYFAAGMNEYAAKNIERAEENLEKTSSGLQKKLLAVDSTNIRAMADAAAHYAVVVEKAIKLGDEINQLKASM